MPGIPRARRAASAAADSSSTRFTEADRDLSTVVACPACGRRYMLEAAFKCPSPHRATLRRRPDDRDAPRSPWWIVGGGLMGLTLAHRLVHRGHEVTIIEAAPEIGGLADAWQLGDIVWDRHYHVILLSDLHLTRPARGNWSWRTTSYGARRRPAFLGTVVCIL